MTAHFGNDAEYYTSYLFSMTKNPNGHRRPDLISINGDYKPKLSIEVKSGAKMKGVMVDYQLHYAVTSEQDYQELFGESPPIKTGVLPGMNITSGALPQQSIAYYYNVLDRVDGLRADNLDKPFSTIKIKWGNHYIVPAEYAFNAFAVARHMRTKEDLGTIVSDLHEKIKSDVVMQTSHYENRKKDPNSWQDIHSRDILAFFKGDDELTTEQGKTRVKVMRDIYPEVDKLDRIKIRAPCKTNIYILAKPEHRYLFDKQMRRVVNRNRPILEEVASERAKAEPLLDKIYTGEPASLFNASSTLQGAGVSAEEVAHLRRLYKWQPKNVQDDEDIDNMEREGNYGDSETAATVGSKEGIPF